MYPEERELIDSTQLNMTTVGNTAGPSSLQAKEVDVLLKLGVILIKNKPKNRSILTVAITEQCSVACAAQEVRLGNYNDPFWS